MNNPIKDPSGRSIEQEEHQFYGETYEDIEREERRRAYEDDALQIEEDDSVNE